MNDVFAQAESIARRKKLFEALQAQSMGAPIVGRTGLGQVLAKLGTTWLTNSGQKDLERESAAQRGQYGQELAGELEKFMTRQQGAPGETLTDAGALDLMQNNVNPQLKEPVAADPKGAVFAALASRFPEMQSVGQAGLKDVLAGAKKSGFKDHSIDGKLVRVYDDGRKEVIGDFKDRDEWEEVQVKDASGKLIPAQRNKRTGKIDVLDKAPKISATATAHGPAKGEDEFMKKLGSGRAENFLQSEQGAHTGVQTKSAVAQMRQLEQQGVFSGPTANLAVTLGGFAQVLGMPVDEAKLANSQAFQQQFAQQIGAYLANSSVGRTLTDKDRELLEKTMPSLLQTPQGRAQIYAMLENASDAAISRHNALQQQLITQYPEHKGMLTVNPVGPGPGRGVPQQVVPPQPGLPSGGQAPVVRNW